MAARAIQWSLNSPAERVLVAAMIPRTTEQVARSHDDHQVGRFFSSVRLKRSISRDSLSRTYREYSATIPATVSTTSTATRTVATRRKEIESRIFWILGSAA